MSKTKKQVTKEINEIRRRRLSLTKEIKAAIGKIEDKKEAKACYSLLSALEHLGQAIRDLK